MDVSGVGPGGDQSQGPLNEPGGPSGNAPLPPPPEPSKKPSPMDLANPKHPHDKKDSNQLDAPKGGGITEKDVLMKMEVSVAMQIMQEMQKGAADMKRIWLKKDWE